MSAGVQTMVCCLCVFCVFGCGSKTLDRSGLSHSGGWCFDVCLCQKAEFIAGPWLNSQLVHGSVFKKRTEAGPYMNPFS